MTNALATESKAIPERDLMPWTSLPSTRHLLTTITKITRDSPERKRFERMNRLHSYFLGSLIALVSVMAACALLVFIGIASKDAMRPIAESAYLAILLAFGTWSLWLVIECIRVLPRHIRDLIGIQADQLDERQRSIEPFLALLVKAPLQDIEERRKAIELHQKELSHRSLALGAMAAAATALPKLLPFLADASNPLNFTLVAQSLGMGVLIGGLFMLTTKPPMELLAYALGVAADRAKNRAKS